MKMSKVKRCSVSVCAYNRDELCNANAITIGDGHSPQCDTFCGPTCSNTKGGESHGKAQVGACKVSACSFNEQLECHAKGIEVGHSVDAADCLTFKMR